MNIARQKSIAATVAVGILTFGSVTIGLAPSANAIVGGSTISGSALTPSGEFGWLVRLEGGGGGICTGSLVDAEWVLTAAHCVDIDDGSGITAFIGNAAGTAVDKVEQHPDFDGSSEADLALMHLAVASSQPPVRFAGFGDTLDVGREVLIAGWGAVNSDGDLPTAPRRGVSSVTDLTPQVVGTGGPDNACSGDSGGPVLLGGVLVAVMSATDAACAEFTLSTRIAAHRDWIARFIGKPNQPPIATGGSITAPAGQPVEITFAFSDPDSDTAFPSALDFDLNVWAESIICVEQPGASVCTFTPLSAFAGTTEVTYQVTDGEGATAQATWVITFVVDPTPPLAEDASITVVAERTTEIQLVASDVNGDPITFTIVEPPIHGSLGVCSTGTCQYTPTSDYTGPDTFSFTAADDGGLVSEVATVTLDVVGNAAPVVSSFSLAVGENTPTVIELSGTDTNNDPLDYTIVAGPTSGTLDGCTQGSCTYTPNADFVGTDSFTFSATDPDGLRSGEAIASIDVVANFAPEVGDVIASTKANLPVRIELDARDQEGDQLSFALVTPPAHGSATLCETGTCTYTPTDGFAGIDTFTWTASDDSGISRPALATIHVAGSTWKVTALSSPDAVNELAAVVLRGDLAGSGSFSGATAAAGTFSGAMDVIGIDAGIVLSTGRAIDVVGPNLDEARFTNHGRAGDDNLFGVIDSFDAASLRYDVVPDSPRLTFRYVFASEEYLEGGYVSTDFDDTAVITVGGQPCQVPGGRPISVSSIRAGLYDQNLELFPDPVNSGLYVDNRFGASPYDTEMDGFSTVIECTVDVVAGVEVAVEIAIADGGDGTIDSALLVEGNIVTDAIDLLRQLREMSSSIPKATSLTAKIDNAIRAVNAERIATACGVMKAFGNETQALSGRKIPATTAAELIATAGKISATLGCS